MTSSIEIFSFRKKYVLDTSKINKKNRKKLFSEIEKFDGEAYLLKGKITGKREDYDELIVCGFRDCQMILLADLPAVEGNSERCNRVTISTEAMKEVLYMTLNLSYKPKSKAGRKPKFSGETGQKIREYLAAGKSIRATARELGISTTTVQKAKKFLYN